MLDQRVPVGWSSSGSEERATAYRDPVESGALTFDAACEVLRWRASGECRSTARSPDQQPSRLARDQLLGPLLQERTPRDVLRILRPPGVSTWPALASSVLEPTTPGRSSSRQGSYVRVLAGCSGSRQHSAACGRRCSTYPSRQPQRYHRRPVGRSGRSIDLALFVGRVRERGSAAYPDPPGGLDTASPSGSAYSTNETREFVGRVAGARNERPRIETPRHGAAIPAARPTRH